MVFIKKASGFLIGLLLAVAGCQKSDTASPTVLSTTPPNSATSVAVTADITVIFSEPMDTVSVQSAFSTEPATTGSFSWENESTVVYNPAAILVGDTTYTVTIDTTAQDRAGNGIAAIYKFSFSTGPVPTEAVELPAVMDAGIDGDLPDWTGKDDIISVYAYSSATREPLYGLIRFDLAAYEGCYIDSAVLKLYVVAPYIYPGIVTISRIDEAWVETTVTWRTKPALDTSIIVTAQIPSQGDEWLEVDVTPLAQSWVGVSFPNHGMYIIVPQQNKQVGFTFAARDYDESAKQPKLHLDYFRPAASRNSTVHHDREANR